jgi:hypothetical protein
LQLIPLLVFSVNCWQPQQISFGPKFAGFHLKNTCRVLLATHQWDFHE